MTRVREMNITEVRVRLVKRDDGKIKAIASVTIDDCFVVHDVKIIESHDDYFVAMPSKRTPDGEFKDIVHPLNTETREQFKETVLKAFRAAKKSAESGRAQGVEATEVAAAADAE